MAQVDLTSEQQSLLQAEVQRELERREWAEPDDNVMAEYITVLLANGNSQERVHSEMDDLVGSDFDPKFLEWLFNKASGISSSRSEPPAPAPAPRSPPATATPAPGGRLLNSALGGLSQPEKRKLDGGHDGQNKKRLSDGVPSGPRGEGRSLADRLGPRGRMQVRGMAGRGMGRGLGPGMGFQPGFRPMMQPGFAAPFFPPQQEMMAQMMMMQANMAQMGEVMAKMAQDREAPPQPVRPRRRPPPAKIPHGTKLGNHAVSTIPPKPSTPGPIPDIPPSKALCRYSVGCSNSRCPYSHPSPVADEKTGMVLNEKPCAAGRGCKDAECTNSHVSPAAILGEKAGPGRMLCKYQNCTNPSCAFRHEDAEGNPIPPPALSAAKASREAKKVQVTTSAVSDGEDGEMEVVMTSKSLMDGPLEDARGGKACRYGERCTRPDCKFTHPASRSARDKVNKTELATGGMNMSKKFGTAATNGKKLDPAAGEFKPVAEVKAE